MTVSNVPNSGAFNPSVSQSSSAPISIDEFLSQLQGFGADTDLAFTVIAEQVRDADTRARARFVDIRRIAQARDKIQQHLTDLREMQNIIKNRLTGRGQSDGTAVNTHDGQWGAVSQQAIEKMQTLSHRFEMKTDKSGAFVLEYQDNALIGNQQNGNLTIGDVEAEIKRWEDRSQSLDSNRELHMVQLNQLISKKANYIELLSNIGKKQHDAQKSVIGNFR